MSIVSGLSCGAKNFVSLGLCLLLVGCTGGSSGSGGGGAPRTTGGDTPVTRDRLTNVRLADIRKELTWKFTDKRVVIENNGQPITPDLVEDLLAEEAAPLRIEAAWELDEKAGLLRLTDLNVDGEPSEREAALPIEPAGHVRINLGDRQYNRFADKAKSP